MKQIISSSNPKAELDNGSAGLPLLSGQGGGAPAASPPQIQREKRDSSGYPKITQDPGKMTLPPHHTGLGTCSHVPLDNHVFSQRKGKILLS